MAWRLKWPADSGSLTANNRLCQLSGIATTGIINISIKYGENFPAQARQNFIYDGRRSLDSVADDGTNSYIFSGGQANTSDWKVNGVLTGSSGSIFNTSRVAGDVVSFNASAQPNGVVSIGARFNATECWTNVAIDNIIVTDANGTHTIDMSSSGGTSNTFTSTDGAVTLKLFNFTGTAHWVFYNSGATYQLTAQGGTFTYSGQAAALNRGFKLAAQGGAYSYTGASASLLRQFKLTAQGGSYSYAGASAPLLRGFKLAANGGAYSYAGASASLTYVSGPTVYRLTALGVTYVYSGGAAALTTTGIIPAANPSAFVNRARVAGAQTVPAKVGSLLVNNARIDGMLINKGRLAQ